MKVLQHKLIKFIFHFPNVRLVQFVNCALLWGVLLQCSSQVRLPSWKPNSAQSSVTQMCMRNVWNSEKLNPEASEGLGFQRGQTTNFINTIKPDIWGWSWNIEGEKKKKVDSAPHLNQQQKTHTTKLPTYGMCGNGTLAPESAVENHRCRNLAALCRESRAIRGKFFKPEVVQNFFGLMIACIALSPLSWADSLRSHVVLHEWLTSFIARFFLYPPKWCTYSAGMAGSTWNCSRLGASPAYTIQPCSMSLHAKPHT